MLTIVCAKTRILRVFPTTYKIFPLRIICLILKTFKNEKHTCRFVRVNEDGSLENSTDVSNLLVVKTYGAIGGGIDVKNVVAN